MAPVLPRLVEPFRRSPAEPGDRLGASRRICVIAAGVYPVFWLLHHAGDPPAFDPLALRLAVSGFALLFVGLSYVSETVRRRAPRWVAAFALVLLLHLVGLAAANGLAEEYVLGILVALIGLAAFHSLGLETRRDLVAFYAVIVLATGVATGVPERPEFPRAYFAAVVWTACALSFLGILGQMAEREALEESRRRLSTVLSGSPILLWEADRSGWLRYLEGDSLGMTAAEREALLGRPLRDLLGEDASAIEALDRALHGERAAALVHVQGRALDTWQIPVRGADGLVRGTVGVATDVTALHETWFKLRQAQKMEAVGRLAGGIAHDFNNILTAILGYSELLLGRPDLDDVERAQLGEIRRASQRAARLTRQLLAFSRRDAIQLGAVDLNAVVRETMGMLRRVIGVEMRLVEELAPGLPPIAADRTGVEQILMNLAINARDASPDDGRLTITTGRSRIDERRTDGAFILPPGDYVTLRVADRGTGMDAETRDRIFEPFFTTKGEGEGTGLGLATVHGIVEQCAGSIEVESTPGEGTAFTVWFRRASAAPVAIGRGFEERLAQAG